MTPTKTEIKTLYYRDGGSDKVYQIQLESVGELYRVVAFNGRRGSALKQQVKTPEPVDRSTAETIFAKVLREKLSKGYTEDESGSAYASTTFEPRATNILPQLPLACSQEVVDELLRDDDWWLQEKKDGVRMMIRILDGTIEGINRRGLTTALPQAIVDFFKTSTYNSLTIFDGELVGDVYHVFDVLALSYVGCLNFLGPDVTREPFRRRFGYIAQEFQTGGPVSVVQTAFTTEEKLEMYRRLSEEQAEGVVLKRRTAPYRPGRASSVETAGYLKFKFVTTATCRVVQLNEGKRSVGLEVSSFEGPVFVGNVTIPVNHPIPQVGDHVEVRYLYWYPGGSLFQPVYLGVRDDVDVDDISTLKPKSEAEDSAA